MTNFSDRIILLNMAIYGKKQINIREDNKSAVVDILLQQEATMPQLAERLMLSHTALAKVVRELMQKNIVLCSEGKGTGSGRPPKVYEINADCAMTCAVILMQKSIDIYYVDMRGFQVNKRTAENDFSSLSALLADVQEYIGTLKEHPRLKDRVLKYIYIGLPTARFYGMDFCESCREVSRSFSERFPGIRNVVRRNVDYAMVAESKYGVLKNNCRNAVLLNLDEYLCASFLLNGSIYDGDRWMQGYDSAQNFPGLQALRAQAAGGGFGVLERDAAFGAMLEWLGGVLRFMDIGRVVLGGSAKVWGEELLRLVSEKFGGRCRAEFSTMGREVPPPLSGAVWLSTYSTLQDMMLR